MNQNITTDKKSKPGGESKPKKIPTWQKNKTTLEKNYQTDTQTGLSTKEAQKRLHRFGLNKLKKHKRSNFLRFIKQFNNSIIYILIATAIITLLVQRYSDTIVIGLVVIANAFIGYFQELSADNALDKITSLLISKNYVIRNKRQITLPSTHLTVGDIVRLEAGDNVPADLRLFSADNLKIKEDILTGESDSVQKTENPLKKNKLPLNERTNIAFAGTSVTNGSGLGIITSIGNQTEVGHIQQNIAQVKTQPTPLIQSLNQLGKGLSIGIIIVAIFLFIIGFLLKVYSLPTLLIAVITMVVGSMPEGLPAGTSVVLAMGTQHLTQKNVIVKSLPSVETLGAVDIVNTDKTGTLTRNEMTVTDISTIKKDYKISAGGYGTKGHLKDNKNQKVNLKGDSDLDWLVNIAGQTSDAQFHKEKNEWVLAGEPTDGALTALFNKFSGQRPQKKELDSLPFDSAIRYSARLVKFKGRKVLMAKGAPHTLVRKIQSFGGKVDPRFWDRKINVLADQGKRIVALGYQFVNTSTSTIDLKTIGKNFHLAGIVGITDPPKAQVKKSINQLQDAGVSVKMITGDNVRTSKAIGKQLNLAKQPQCITGTEIENMPFKELVAKINKYTIFARTTPQDKLKIVRAQQENHHVVSMTGDGVNDAPALKQANIGVAMGHKGTDVAKGAADMILVDDNFSSILTAVKKGRHVFDNIRKTIRFLLPTSFAEGLVVALSIFLQQELPLYPTQLLWINMVSALTIQFAFIFEPAEEKIMSRGPRNVHQNILNKIDVGEIVFISLLISSVGIFFYDYFSNQGVSNFIGSTMTLNVIIFGKIAYLFILRNRRPLISKYFFQNIRAFYIIGILILLQLFIIYTPFMEDIFHTTNVNLFYGWLIPFIAGIIVLIIAEIFKAIRTKGFKV